MFDPIDPIPNEENFLFKSIRTSIKYFLRMNSSCFFNKWKSVQMLEIVLHLKEKESLYEKFSAENIQWKYLSIQRELVLVRVAYFIGERPCIYLL